MSAPGSPARSTLRSGTVRTTRRRSDWMPNATGPTPLPVRLSADTVDLGPMESAGVAARYSMPLSTDVLECRLRATSEEYPEVSTYSTLTLRAGTSPVRRPIQPPLVFRPYEHENAQFGYAPDLPVENQIYFDMDNRPFVRTETGLATLRDGAWTTSDFRNSVLGVENAVFGAASTKIAFDSENLLYLVANVNSQPNLLYSADHGLSFSTCAIAGKEDHPLTFDIEWFTGHNTCDGPPPILRYARTGEDVRLFWRKVNDLELFLPENTTGRHVVGRSDSRLGPMHRALPALGHSRLPLSRKTVKCTSFGPKPPIRTKTFRACRPSSPPSIGRPGKWASPRW